MAAKLALKDIGVSASPPLTDSFEEKVFVLQEHDQELNHPSEWSSTGLWSGVCVEQFGPQRRAGLVTMYNPGDGTQLQAIF